MLLSIVMPVYNVEQYLYESIESILNQTNQDFELILVDDGSTDESRVICKKYAERFPQRIRLIRKDNDGLLLARRSGFSIAQGEYLMSIDSDDMLRDGALEAISNVIKAHRPDIVLIGYSRDFQSAECDVPVFQESTYIAENRMNEIRHIFCNTSNIHSMCCKIIHRNIFNFDDDYSELHGFNNAEDLLQSSPIIDKCKSLYYICRPLYFYRVNYQSINKQFQISKAEQLWYANNIQMQFAAKWERTYDEKGLIAGVELLRLRSYAEMAQSAIEGCSTKEATIFLKAISNNPIFNECYQHKELSSMLRMDYRLFIYLLHSNNYQALIIICRLKRFIRKNILKR